MKRGETKGRRNERKGKYCSLPLIPLPKSLGRNVNRGRRGGRREENREEGKRKGKKRRMKEKRVIASFLTLVLKLSS